MTSTALRVALVYDDTIDRVGGIGLYVMTLGEALAARGHHVEYLIGSSSRSNVGGSAVHSLARNVNVRFNGNELSMPAWSSGRGLAAVLAQGRFDVLHVQVPYSPLMAGRLMALTDERCAVVGTYHVASERRLPQLGAVALRALTLRSSRRFDELVAVSDAAAAFASRWSRLESGSVVPNLLDLAGARAQLAEDTPSVDADVVFVGRLVPRKGVAQLLAALGCMRGSGGNVPRVAILGDGPLRGELERRAAALGLRAHVTFYGEVDEPFKLAALRSARVACFPSLYGESFGVVILEALAAGAEVVLGGANPGYRELLRDDRALVDPRDARAFADRLAQLLAKPRLRAELGAAQRAVLARCEAGRVCADVLDVYERALARRRGAAVARLPTATERLRVAA